MYKQFQQNQTSYQTTQDCTILPKITQNWVGQIYPKNNHVPAIFRK